MRGFTVDSNIALLIYVCAVDLHIKHCQIKIIIAITFVISLS